MSIDGESRPRLVLQITIDGLRGDLGAAHSKGGDSPFRLRKWFGSGGFGRLMDHGVWYTAASHPHAHTETIVGHTTLSTGTYPKTHGMISNQWFDANRAREGAPDDVMALGAHASGLALHEVRWQRPAAGGFLQAAMPEAPHTIADNARVVAPEYELLPVDGSEFLDLPGHSPVHILSETLSDVIVDAGGKAFGVSIKDRAAVAMAGKKGKAFWFFNLTHDSSRPDPKPVPPENLGRFVSSTYYYSAEDYPQWAVDWNGENNADQWDNGTWSLLRDEHDYSFPNTPPDYLKDSYIHDMDFAIFPLKFGKKDDPKNSFYYKLPTSPMGDQLLLGFARALIENEELGSRDDRTDYLSISFSATDMANHVFGPSTLQAEDNLLQLDQTLAELFNFVDQHVGHEHTLIVLAGDHGVPEPYQNWEDKGAGQVVGTAVEAAVKTALGEEQYRRVVDRYRHPYFYLKADLSDDERADFARRIAGIVAGIEGVARAVPWMDLNDQGDDALTRMSRNQCPPRSGHVYVVQEQYWQVVNKPSSGEHFVILDHGSPYYYDTWVPMVFAGGGVGRGHPDRPVSVVDAAPTLAARLGFNPPDDSVGDVLPEVNQPGAAV